MNNNYVSEYMTADKLIKQKILKPGDLIEFNRNIAYKHWALMEDDDDTIIHFTGEPTNKKDAKISRGSLREAADTSKVRINNKRDSEYDAGQVDEILKRARDRIGTRSCGSLRDKYDVTMNNCEHFVTYCRYGSCDAGQTAALFCHDGKIYHPRHEPQTQAERDAYNRENMEELWTEAKPLIYLTAPLWGPPYIGFKTLKWGINKMFG